MSLLLMRTALPGGPEPATAGMTLKPVLAGILARLPGVRVRFLTDAFGVVVRVTQSQIVVLAAPRGGGAEAVAPVV